MDPRRQGATLAIAAVALIAGGGAVAHRASADSPADGTVAASAQASVDAAAQDADSGVHDTIALGGEIGKAMDAFTAEMIRLLAERAKATLPGPPPG
jgi:hypothetical protein